MEQKYIDDYIDYVCNILEIKKPKVTFTDDKLRSTMMAGLDPINNKMIVKADMELIDALFAIAHELRHMWQHQYNAGYFFNDYKANTELSTEEYNLQPAEIDANAFGMVMVEEITSVSPLFEGFSPQLVNKIQQRADDIVDGLDSSIFG